MNPPYRFERLTPCRWRALIAEGYEYLRMEGVKQIHIDERYQLCFVVRPLFTLMGSDAVRKWIEPIASDEIRELVLHNDHLPVYLKWQENQ